MLVQDMINSWEIYSCAYLRSLSMLGSLAWMGRNTEQMLLGIQNSYLVLMNGFGTSHKAELSANSLLQ